MPASRKTTDELLALREDNARLRAENTRLMQRSQSARNPPSGKKLRTALSALFVSVAVVLLSIGNILFWFGNTIVKPERFAEATQPLIEDAEVRDSTALYLTNKLFENIDVQKVTTDALPPRADFLAPALTDQLRTFTNTALDRAFAKPAVQEAWNTTLANQHERLVSFAESYEGSGTVTLNQVFTRAASNLADTRLSFLADKQLPASVGAFTVVESEWLPLFHTLVTSIDTWRFISLLLLAVSLAIALWISADRRKVMYAFSLAAGSMMLATLIAVRIVTGMAADRVDDQYAGGAQRATEILLQPLRIQTIALLVALLIIAATAWMYSTSPRAVRLKRGVSHLFAGNVHERLFSKERVYTRWIAVHKRTLQWLVVTIISLLLLLVPLTLMSLLGYLVLMIVLLLGLEILGGRGPDSSTEINTTKPI